MQTTSAEEVGARFTALSVDEVAGTPTTAALAYVEALFGRRGRRGIKMASRALRGLHQADTR